MKKSFLVFIMTAVLIFGGLNLLRAQEQPAPKKDTVNMDTNAKPEFYYAIEDEDSAGNKKGGSTTVIIIVAAVVIVAGVAVMLLRKKK